MLDYGKTLKNKNEFLGIQKKISKLDYFLLRVEQDMKSIRKQAEQVKNKSMNQLRILQQRIELIRKQSENQLRKISIELSQKVVSQQQKSLKINQRLSQLKQQQLKNKETIKELIIKITAIEHQL